MIVTLNWLRDWVDFDLNAEDLANSLTTVGLEVGSVSRIDPVSKKIVVGLIRSVGVHPKSSRFMVCEVDVGRPRTARIVSSDENIRTDMCVYTYFCVTLPRCVDVCVCV